ncbi:hypothetical protein [Klebsiella pneumoniae]|uniref:hypothetical protein n=1 Tax=Klebsiella pneumoniae TaxID=573 RepID=UPI00388EC0BC
MSDEVVKPGNEEALSPNQSLSEAIKDKIFNKIYLYFSFFPVGKLAGDINPIQIK